MSVQALGAELAVEALDVAIVGGFSGPREVKHDTLVIGPQVEVTRDEFAAIVDTDRGRITDLPAHSLKRQNHVFAPVAEASVDCRREAREGIDDRQHLILRPVANWSWTKSIAHTWLEWVASVRSARSFALTRRLGTLLRSWTSISL